MGEDAALLEAHREAGVLFDAIALVGCEPSANDDQFQWKRIRRSYEQMDCAERVIVQAPPDLKLGEIESFLAVGRQRRRGQVATGEGRRRKDPRSSGTAGAPLRTRGAARFPHADRRGPRGFADPADRR